MAPRRWPARRTSRRSSGSISPTTRSVRPAATRWPGRRCWPACVSLDLTGCRIGPDAAAELLGQLRDPETLRLASNDIGDPGALAIAAQRRWTRLRILDIAHDAIAGDGFVALAEAPQLAGLTTLTIRGNEPGERGWRALVETSRFPGLVEGSWRRQLAVTDTTLGPADAARTVPGDFELKLRRRGCFGTCPIFAVTAHADGRLEYRGENYVRISGKVEDRVEQNRIKLVLAALDKFERTSPAEHPARGRGCNVHTFDNENVRVEVRRGGKTLQYDSEELCPTAASFTEIFALADRICALLDTGRWI